MNGTEYCEERAPLPGSSSYYALRMAPDRLRSLSLYVLLKELFAVVSISDAGVAHAKLAWWRTEISRLADQSATHPLAAALISVGFSSASGIEQLLHITAAVDIDLTQSRFLDGAALNRYLDAPAAAPARALAIAAGLDETAQQRAGHLGLSLGRARLISELGRHARQQRIYLPHQTLRDYQVPAADLLNGRDTPNLRSMAAALTKTAQDELTHGLAQLRGQERRQLRSLVALAALARARLGEIAEDGFRVAVHRIGLTPLRKLLISWRSAHFGT